MGDLGRDRVLLAPFAVTADLRLLGDPGLPVLSTLGGVRRSDLVFGAHGLVNPFGSAARRAKSAPSQS